MSAEDRLREILREQAKTVVPAGDGLKRIQARIARRRQWRLWLLPSAALVTAGAAAAFFLLSPDDGRRTSTLEPGATATPTTSAQPSPTTVPFPGDYDGPAYWPFSSYADAAGLADVPAWATDQVEVGTRLVRDVLAVEGATIEQSCVSCEVLGIKVGGKIVGQVELGHYTVQGKRVFTVVDINGTDLTITSPQPGTAVSSPTSVTGRVTGVDESVLLKLVAKDGGVKGQTSAPAGSAVPWSASLSWTANDWANGALLAVTASNKDGSITRVALIPVTRGAAATAGFAGLVDGHVALFDAVTGKRVRQLTYPPAGTTDSEATWSAGTLAWVRTKGASVCVDELDQLRGTEPATSVVKSTTAHLRSPQLSADGGLLAWVEIPCDGTTQHVVVRGGGAPDRRLEIPHDASVLDVRDDGTLLVWEHNPAVSGGNLVVVPPGALTLDTAPAITPASGCETGTAAAFDSQGVVLFEICNGDGTFVHYSDAGARGAEGNTVKGMEPPSALSVRDDRVLVWLFGGDSYGAIARYADGIFTTLINNDGCTSVGPTTGCVAAPDW